MCSQEHKKGSAGISTLLHLRFLLLLFQVPVLCVSSVFPPKTQFIRQMCAVCQKRSFGLSLLSRYICLDLPGVPTCSHRLDTPCSLTSKWLKRNPAQTVVSLELHGVWVGELGFFVQLLRLIPPPEFPLSCLFLASGVGWPFSALHDSTLGILPCSIYPQSSRLLLNVWVYEVRWAIAMQSSIENHLKLDILCLKFLWPFSLPQRSSPLPRLSPASFLGPSPSTCSHFLYQFSNSWSPPSWSNQGDFKRL